MIDEKKITEAVDEYIGYPKELGEGVDVSMRRDAFREGAKWFKEALWHNTSEEPQVAKQILVQWLNEGEVDYEADWVFPGVDWCIYVKNNNIIKWCYIDDLLPKGGEK